MNRKLSRLGSTVLLAVSLSVAANEDSASVVEAEAAEPSVGPGQMHRMTEEERAQKRAEMRARHESMTVEERKAMREKMRAQMKARRASMTDEQRAAMHGKMMARRESMSEEERAEFDEKMRARREAMGKGQRAEMHARKRERGMMHHQRQLESKGEEAPAEEAGSEPTEQP
jgi:hypothetical protein